MASRWEQEFLLKVEEKWGDRWDFSKMVYRKALTPIIVICSEHGEFQQTPSDMLKLKMPCPSCRQYIQNTDSFIIRATETWGQRWDYSDTYFESSSTKVSIRCFEHGEFHQLPWNHVLGAVGCEGCRKVRKTSQGFEENSKEVWGDSRWRYERTDYSGHDREVTITCPDHGDFTQVAEYHLRGVVGCHRCKDFKVSRPEQELIAFLRELEPSLESNVRGVLSNPLMELDAYISRLNLAFEFNGLYWHSEKFKSNDYHLIKRNSCLEVGINLYQIWEDDWRDRRTIVEEHIKRLLGTSSQLKVPAREMRIREIGFQEAATFLDTHHIQGRTTASHYIGGFHEDSLVMVAAFKKRGGDVLTYELTRYATSAIVQGGHSKVVTWFERRFTYSHLVTFADLAFSNGDLYLKTGWKEHSTLPPDYKYLRGGRREHKFNYRLKRFRDDPSLKYEDSLTERELSDLNNLLRVYDAGKIRFIKPHPKYDTLGEQPAT